MDPYVARALISRLLNDSERLDLAKYEAWLQTQPHMQGRYLVGSELCQRYHLKPEPVSAADTDRMANLLWIWQQKQDAIYTEMESKSNGEPFDIHAGDNLANLRDWEKYADENYHAPLPQYPSMVCLAVLLLPLMWN